MAHLRALAELILDGVEKLEHRCAERGEPYPSLNDPYSSQTTAVQNKCASDAAPIIAAAYQLIATLTHPDPYLFTSVMSTFYSASIAASSQGAVPDILREAGPKGMHVNDIANKNGMDPTKLENILRLLVSRHVFSEVSPAVFRNNRISTALCTGKSPAELFEKPLDKYDNTNGVAALNEFTGTTLVKAAGSLVDHLTDPLTAHAHEPDNAPINRAFNSHLPLHIWLQQPENIKALKGLQHGMRAMTGYASSDLPSGGFDWAHLPEKSIVVDIGGGIGTVTMDLAVQHGHLRYVVQDLPPVISQARQFWTTKMPQLLHNETVRLQACDFFEEQPVKDADVFLVRYILHNWPDAYCIKLLQRLRSAATATTKLVILDQIVDYLSPDAPSMYASIPGGPKAPGPAVLELPYPDAPTGFSYYMDMLMLGVQNAQERTLDQFMRLLERSGWNLERVCRFQAPHPQEVICVPA